MHMLEQQTSSITQQRHVSSPRLVYKITLPYVLLAFALALAVLYVVAHMRAASVASAFDRQLADARLRVADSFVRTEQAQLADVRTLARLTGLGQAIRSGDEPALLQLITPYAVGQNIDRVAAIGADRRTFSAVQVNSAGPLILAPNNQASQWPAVTQVIKGAADARGDKYIALVDDAGDPVIYTVAPVYTGDVRVGALLVGSNAQALVERLQLATFADVTLYDANGQVLATSFGADPPPTLEGAIRETAQGRRDLALGSRQYNEVVTPLVLRGAATSQFVGVALSTAGQSGLLQNEELPLLAIFAGGIATALILGIALSRRITQPITTLVQAAARVANGDLNHALPVTSRDEIGALTGAFNAMVSGLRERERMSDILGRFVTPTVARLVLSRPLDLSGESKLLTILFTDLRDFTTLTEREDPAVVISGLNAYFTIVVESAERFGGIVNKFGGDSTLVLFGLTDERSDSRASAEAAVRASLAIRDGLNALNQQRVAQSLPTLASGIGINTGQVVAGLIGAQRRMEYTVIGDAVNLSARIQGLSRELDGDILISDATYTALGAPADLEVHDYGQRQVKGKRQAIGIYSVIDWRRANDA